MYVVAGASGRTGRVVTQTLLSNKEQVRAIVRDAAKAPAGAEPFVASLEDRAALARALQGARGFYVLLPEDPAAENFHAQRERIADSIAAAVRASGVPHVVFLSAIAASLADGNGPAQDLHYAENALRATGVKLTILRSCYFQDNVLDYACPAEHESSYPNFLPSADIAFPAIATKDVGKIAARLLVEPPAKSEVVDLVGPTYSIRDMAQRLGAAVGNPNVRVFDVPSSEQVNVLANKAGLPRPFAEILVEMFACFASGRVRPQGDRVEAGATELDEVLREGLKKT